MSEVLGFFVLPKKSLEDAMKLLDSVPTRNGITSSEFIKTSLKDPKHLVMTMSSELSGEAIIPIAKTKEFDSTLYLDRRMLKPFVAAGTDLAASDIYTFTIYKNQIVVKNGARIARLESNNTASGYEKKPSLKEGLSIELQEEWTSITNCATMCACTDPIAPSLNCVHIQPVKDKVYIRASDTKLIFQGVIPASAFPCKVPVALPLELVDRLGLFTTGICHYSSKWAMLQFPIGFIWQAVKTECRKSFPVESISKVALAIVKEGEVVSVLGTQSLIESADRIAGYLQSAMRDNPVLKLQITAGSKAAKLVSGTIGASFDEAIGLEHKAEKDYEVDWPLQAVLPILKYCKNVGSAKIIQDASGKSCLKAGRVTLVVSKLVTKKKKKGK